MIEIYHAPVEGKSANQIINEVIKHLSSKFVCENVLKTKIELTNFYNIHYEKSLNRYKEEVKNNKTCYIATLVYGSVEHDQAKELRNFRDERLINYKLGRKFIKFYYQNSPNWLIKLENKNFLNTSIRILLNLLIKTTLRR